MASASYQHQYEAVPVVHQYDDDATNTNSRYRNIQSSLINVMNRAGYYGGDTTIRPNLPGQTNSYEYSLFGLAYHEIVDYQKNMTLVLCCTTGLYIFITTVIKRFFQPIQLVLSIYLLFFVVLLGLSDLIVLLGNKYEITRIGYEFILNNLGLLYYPFPGRCFYLLLCGTLCISIHGIIECILGIGFILLSILTVYCWIVYPLEYRKPYEEIQQQFFYKYYTSNTTSQTDDDLYYKPWSVFNPGKSNNDTERQSLVSITTTTTKNQQQSKSYHNVV